RDAEISAEKKEKVKGVRERGGSGVKRGLGARHFRLADEVLRGTLRRPGLSGFCRAHPAASDFGVIYEDVGTVLITLGPSSVPSFRFSTSVSDGAAIGAIRTPPAIIRSNGRSSR